MKRRPAERTTLVLLCLIWLVRPVHSQTATLPPAGPFTYDVSQEVTLNGTVSGVITTQAPRAAAGAHLLLATLSGQVDVSLGTLALRGKDALSVAPGQQVEVVGIMKTLKDKRFFLAREIKAADRVYEIRNQHGIPISPQARERARQNAAQNWETR